MESTPDRLIDDPAYMYGQVLALRALLLVVAGKTMDADTFATTSLASLERLRIATLPSGLGDAALTAIEQTEQWVRLQTAPSRPR